MKVFIGADHRGYKLKEFLRGWLMGGEAPHHPSTVQYETGSVQGLQVVDCGAEELNEEDDYVDYAVRVAQHIIQNSKFEIQNYGIVICGSGVGVCMVANKVKGIRCGLGFNAEQVREARENDDINILALAADYTDVQQAKDMVRVFLETKFSGKRRHKRRLKKFRELEDDGDFH